MLRIRKYNFIEVVTFLVVVYIHFNAGLPEFNITPSVILMGQQTNFTCTNTANPAIDTPMALGFVLKFRRAKEDKILAVIPSESTTRKYPHRKPHFKRSQLNHENRASIFIYTNSFTIKYDTTVCGDGMLYKCNLEHTDSKILGSGYSSLLIIDNTQPITIKKNFWCPYSQDECTPCNTTIQKKYVGIVKSGQPFTLGCSKEMPFPATGSIRPNTFIWYIERNGKFEEYKKAINIRPTRRKETTPTPKAITYGCEDNLQLHTSTMTYTPTDTDGRELRVKCEIRFEWDSLSDSREATATVCVLGNPISTTDSTVTTSAGTTHVNISSNPQVPTSNSGEIPDTPNHNLVTIIAASIPVGIAVFGVIIAICVVMVRRERRIMKCIRASESGSGTPTPSDDIVLSASRISHLTQPSDATQTQSRLSRFSATNRDHTDIDDDCRSRGAMCTDSDYIAGERSKFDMINDKRKKVGIYIDMGKPTVRKAYRPRDDIEMENMNSADRIIMDHASLNKNNNQRGGGGRKIRIDYEDGYLEMNTESGSIRIKPNRNDHNRDRKRVRYVGDDDEVKDGGGKDGVRFGPADGAENGGKERSQMVDVNGRGGGGGKKAASKTMSM